MSVDDEWSNFIDNSDEDRIILKKTCDIDKLIPKFTDIYISTKTKIIYLNMEIDIYDIFWKIPIIDYNEQKEGIIKKQIKISSISKEDSIIIDENLKNEKIVVNKIINFIDNPNGRVKFKDIRKISIGICKKDLIFTRVKDKSAFYNCFVITLRIIYNNLFREFHIKIFNTGKLEIPGLQNDEMLNIIILKITTILKNLMKTDIYYIQNKTENVLINSNFNCGFYINRDKLFNILRHKYHINACYDPCSYPGIQCVYYYDNINKIDIVESIKFKKTDNNILKISYMIFRTGSILIVGKCNEDVINNVYNFIKNILIEEYQDISIHNIDTTNTKLLKKTKFKKKIIYNNDYSI